MIIPNILYHSLGAIFKLNDFPVKSMGDAFHVGNTVTNPTDVADFLILCFQVELIQLGQNGFQSGRSGFPLQFTFQSLFQLCSSSGITPIKLAVATLHNESSFDGFIMHGLNLNVLPTRLLFQKCLNMRKLFLRRLRHCITQFGNIVSIESGAASIR